MNEIVQWAILGVLAILVLGIYRQLDLTSQNARNARPGKLRAGDKIPKRLGGQATTALGQETALAAYQVAFITESCVGCQHLLAELEKNGSPPLPLLLIVETPSLAFASSLDDLGVPYAADTGALWSECGIIATPTILRISAGRVLAREATHDIYAAAH